MYKPWLICKNRWRFFSFCITKRKESLAILFFLYNKKKLFSSALGKKPNL